MELSLNFLLVHLIVFIFYNVTTLTLNRKLHEILCWFWFLIVTLININFLWHFMCTTRQQKDLTCKTKKNCIHKSFELYVKLRRIQSRSKSLFIHVAKIFIQNMQSDTFHDREQKEKETHRWHCSSFISFTSFYWSIYFFFFCRRKQQQQQTFNTGSIQQSMFNDLMDSI